MANVKISGLTSAAAAAAANEFEINEAGTSKKVTGAQIATYVKTTLDGDKGDITVSASGATWSVDALAITSGKLAAGAATLAKLDTTGASGKVLTAQGSGVAPTWESASGARSGADYLTLSSGTPNITLTSASNQLQVVTATAEGQTITLPDMTTLTAGSGYFVFYNTSVFPIGIKDAGGTVREYLYPSSSNLYANSPSSAVPLNIESIASANGVWHLQNPISAGIATTATQVGTAITLTNLTGFFSIHKYSATQYLFIGGNRISAGGGAVTVKLGTLDPSTKTFTFGSQISLGSSPTYQQVYTTKLDTNGTDRGLLCLFNNSDYSSQGASAQFFGVAVVAGVLYVSTVSNFTYATGTASAGAYPVADLTTVFYTGADDCFIATTGASMGAAQYAKIYGLKVGLSGTTVTLTAATGNAINYSTTTLGYQYSISPTSRTTFVVDDSNNNIKTFINYATATNTLTSGTRTSQTTRIAGVLISPIGYISSDNYILGSNGKQFAYNTSTSATNPGTATVTVTSHSYNLKGFPAKSYASATTGVTALSVFPTSASSYNITNGSDTIYIGDPSNTDFNFNKAQISIPAGNYVFYTSATTILLLSLTTLTTSTGTINCNILNPAIPFVS